MRRVTLLLVSLMVAGCQRPAAAPRLSTDSVDALLASLDEKCGETVPEIEELLRTGADRLQKERRIPMEATVLAYVLDDTLPAGEYRQSCAPKVDSLVLGIMM